MKNRARLVLIVFAVFIPLNMFMEVMRMPEFRGAYVYVDHSPDSSYKSLLILLPNEWLNREQTFSDIFFDSGYKRWGVLMDAKTEEVLGFYDFGKDWDSAGGVWVCNESDGQCKERYFGYEKQPTILPPSLWRRMHAKFFVWFREFDIPSLHLEKIHCDDKPIHPPINVVCTNEPVVNPN